MLTKGSAVPLKMFVLFCVFFGGLGQGVVNPKIPELLGGEGNLAENSGISASLMYLAIFFASFQYGKWADRGKLFFLLRGGLISYTGILILFAFTRTKEGIFLLRFFEGLSLSAIFVSADVVLCRSSSDEDRGRWLSYYGVALSLGLLFGPAILLILESLDVPSAIFWSLLVVAFFAILSAFLSFTFHLPTLETQDEVASLNRRASISAALYGFLEAGLVAVLAAAVLRSFSAKIETIFIVLILSAAAASAIWGIIIDRVGGRTTLFCVHLVLCAGLAVIAFLEIWFEIF